MNKRGQGLLETIVAIGVVMTGLVSVMALVISNLNTQRDAAMRYQAISLAREGIELVRNRRDTNWLTPDAGTWEGLPEGGGTALGTDFIPAFEPGSTDAVALIVAAEQGYQVCQADSGVFFQEGDGCTEGVERATIFSRRITLEQFDCDAELPELNRMDCDSFSQQDDVAIRVTALVTWQQGDRERNVTVTQTLYDWR